MQLPDPSDYSDDSEALDIEFINKEWESNLFPQNAIKELKAMIEEADHDSTKGERITIDELNHVDFRGGMLATIEELEDYCTKPKEAITLTLDKIEELYVKPVRKELQGALDVAVERIEKLEQQWRERPDADANQIAQHERTIAELKVELTEAIRLLDNSNVAYQQNLGARMAEEIWQSQAKTFIENIIKKNQGL